MQSQLYVGHVKHRRHQPHKHAFVYKVWYLYLSLDEINDLQKLTPILSVDKFNLLSLKQSNYLTQYSIPLKQAIFEHFKTKNIHYEGNHVFLLTQLSYLGFCYNPVSFFYCFDKTGTHLEYILAEIHNTPWNERYIYTLACEPNQKKLRFQHAKAFHISPFLPMDIKYDWRMNKPTEKIMMHLQDFKEDKLCFDATLHLTKKNLTQKNVLQLALLQPFNTQRVLFGIYWQALKLFLKKTPFFSHPQANS